MSAIGAIVTVSLAELLSGLGSPSTVLLTVAVLVKGPPSCNGRFTSSVTVTLSPGRNAPPFWAQVSVAPLVLQAKVALLPTEATAVIAPNVVLPAMNAGTLSVMRTPVAASVPGNAVRLVTTRV